MKLHYFIEKSADNLSASGNLVSPREALHHFIVVTIMKLASISVIVLVAVFGMLKCVSANIDECRRSELKILNGMETLPDPGTLMLASSERDRRHSAAHGLAFGSTGWSPKRRRQGEWLEADLGSWALVSQVRVYLLTPGVKVEVEAGLDPATWEKASTVSHHGRVIKAEFDPPVLSQYVRVTITGFYDDIELEMMAIGCQRRRAVAEENLLYN